MTRRCTWPGDDELMIAYHDEEWGVPVHDDRRHFEFLVLDAFQAGLSWRTILHKRENFRRALDGFDPHVIARYTARKRERLLLDAGIVRNRAKVEATVKNARAFLEVQEEFGSFDRFVWGVVDGQTIQNRWKAVHDIPARSAESDALSRGLKARGFSFVGSTICYAYMQAAGMVNDHVTTCFRHNALSRARSRAARKRQ